MQIPETEIIVSKDGAELLRKTVRPGDYVIGREAGCEVRVEAEQVAPRHAQLTVNFDHALIEDLGSDSGTFVNGQPVKEPTRLWPNQKIQIGSASVELRRIKAAPAPDVSLAPQNAAVQRLLPEEFLRDKKYDIGQIVAQGGMGAILDARDATTERRVAMKVMLDSSSRDDLTRFVAEAKVTAQLEHPSIVPVYELSVDENGQVFYTMKMVRGITLKKVLELLAEGTAETVKKYPLSVLLTIFQKVCDALAFAHAKGVIHRDLKPENIMLDDFGVVLVMDWGLAKVIGRDGSPSRPGALEESALPRTVVRTLPPEASGATLAGTVMGTPQYMSPEQARGEVEDLDVRSDIYALGVILYHILALRPPVTGKDAWAIVAKVSQGAVEPLVVGQAPRLPSTGRPAGGAPALQHLPGGRIPDSLTAVVRKAMAFDRDERYPHVADLQRDIEAYQNGRATRAENASLGKQLVLLVKRHKALFSTAAAAWLIITALAVWFLINITKAKNQAEAERNVATHERDRAETEKTRAEKNLTELRGTAPTFVAQATALVEAGKPDDALEKIGYAIQLDPKNPGYRLQRANLLEAGQRLADAAAAYREVLALDPTNRSAKDNLALCERLLADNGDTLTLRRDLQVQLVDALLREGRAVEAGPLAAQLGKGLDAVEATLRARLKEYAAQPDWSKNHIQPLPDGTFQVYLAYKKLGDLSVMQGLPISDLNLGGSGLKDLRSIAALPLTALRISTSAVNDLSPLHGLKLEILDCSSCPIADLDPLRGMPLRRLVIDNTQVSDLSVLAGMPLENLSVHGLSINSLAPLHGLPLQRLDLSKAKGELDLSDLADCRELEEIVIPNEAANIQSLRGLPKLARLRVEGFQDALVPAEKFWAEFKPEMEAIGNLRLVLKKAGISMGPLNSIGRMIDGTLVVNLAGTKIMDLEFLRGFQVSRLIVYDTKVRDLSPLRGMPLTFITAYGTEVTDIEPLRGLPLTQIDLRKTRVASVAALRDCPTLEALTLPRGVRDLEVLRQFPKLRLLSYDSNNATNLPDKTAEQFWKEYDAQQKGAAK